MHFNKNYIGICLALLTIIAVIAGFVSNYFYTENMLSFINEKGQILKIDIDISSKAGFKKMSITERNKLDIFSAELKKMKETNVQHGGLITISAHVLIYKNNERKEFMADKSPFYGWRFYVGNKTFEDENLFALIEANK